MKYPELEYVKAPGMPFSLKPLGFLRFCVSQVAALFFCLRLIHRRQPDLIFGFGGFVTCGIAVAGFFLNFPVVLHEANRRPGKAVRLLSGLSQRIYLPEGVAFRSLVPKIVRFYGYPVRADIRKIDRAVARRNLGLDVRGELLLVFGGSQGAASLNAWAREHFEALAEKGISLVCVTGMGKGTEGVVEHRSAEGRVQRAYFLPFCDDMGSLLSAADLAIARAGAGTIAEFIRCRLPAILVPYPYSADGHQQENALFVEQKGAAVVIEESRLDALLGEVVEMMANDWVLSSMQANLSRLDREDNLALIIEDIEAIAMEHRSRTKIYKPGNA